MSKVSIHAPTRGATGATDESVAQAKFQSTHPHGVRRLTITHMLRIALGFNPRTHTGCDIALYMFISQNPCFNPRTHTGCD